MDLDAVGKELAKRKEELMAENAGLKQITPIIAALKSHSMEPRRQAGLFVLTDWQAMQLRSIEIRRFCSSRKSRRTPLQWPPNRRRDTRAPRKKARTGPGNLKQHLLLIKNGPKGTAARRPEIRG